MTLKELLTLWRGRTDDTTAPYLWGDADGVAFANDAEREACERASLLTEDSTDSPINNISGVVGTVATGATYALDDRIIEVRSATWGGHFLERTSRSKLNDTASLERYGGYFDYREWASANDWATLLGTPRFFMVERQQLTLVRIPTVAAPIRLSCFRYPVETMTLDEMERGPEIPARYHLHLVDWMEHLAYDNTDADKGDPERAAKKAASFTAKFGERPSAENQRKRIESRSNQVRMNPDW